MKPSYLLLFQTCLIISFCESEGARTPIDFDECVGGYGCSEAAEIETVFFGAFPTESNRLIGSIIALSAIILTLGLVAVIVGISRKIKVSALRSTLARQWGRILGWKQKIGVGKISKASDLVGELVEIRRRDRAAKVIQRAYRAHRARKFVQLKSENTRRHQAAKTIQNKWKKKKNETKSAIL
jgi:hypothetical protein